MSIKLKHSGGNSVSLNPPTSAPTSSEVAFKLPTSDGTAGQVLTTDGSGNLSWKTPGKILQVVSTEKTDTFSTTSTSFADVTGFSVTITPSSSSSKILILTDAKCGTSTNLMNIYLRILRGSTPVYVGDTASNRQSCLFGMEDVDDSQGPYEMIQVSGNFQDTPNTTSAVTYKLQYRVNDSSYTGYINRTGGDSDNINFPRTASSIIAMEVSV